MGSRAGLYHLLIGLAFTLTQPGAIAFANWDAPYGFYKDLSAWMASAGAFLLLVAAYGFIQWRKGKLGPLHPLLAGILAIVTLAIGYWAEGLVGGNYGSSSVLFFIIGSFLGLILALMLFPVALLEAITGGLYHPYDRPLVVAWLVSVLITLALLVPYLRSRHGKAKSFENHPDGQERHDHSKGPL
ncbi:hypothetical protein [Thermococcus sp.]|uniref:hypothetical protein n=1 Tax=Thermococcus sp. TaxID=35749 RepID=UPI002620DAF0|nr:hypothetical protein [Thermococcus sp.]